MNFDIIVNNELFHFLGGVIRYKVNLVGGE